MNFVTVQTGSQNDNLKIAESPEPQRFGALPFMVNNYLVKVQSSMYNSNRCLPEFSKTGLK